MVDSQNPYASVAGDQLATSGRSATAVLKWLLIAMSVYYVFSSITLPFADDVWIGEIPLLGLPQIPKSWLFSSVRGWMVEKAFELGIGKGSASPTIIAATPWAFAVLFVLPALLMTTVVAICRKLKKHRRWVWLMVAAATMDAMVSLWFDKTSNLSVF